MKNALSFVSTIRPNLRRLRIPFLSLTPFAHRYPSQTLLRLKIYQKLFFTHMHNWLSLYMSKKYLSICRNPLYFEMSRSQIRFTFHSLRTGSCRWLHFITHSISAPIAGFAFVWNIIEKCHGTYACSSAVCRFLLILLSNISL